MGTIANAFAAAFRAFNTDGVPATGAHKPAKSEVQALGAMIETAIAAGVSGGTQFEATAIIDPAAGAGERLPGIYIGRATVFPANWSSNKSDIVGDLPSGGTETYSWRLYLSDGSNSVVGQTMVATDGTITRTTTNPAGFTTPDDCRLIPFGDPSPKGASGYYETFIGTIAP